MGSSPGWSYGYVPTPAQWNFAFSSKQDELGFTPVNRAGDTMSGPLITTASTAAGAGFAISVGVAPNAPEDGDIWVTSTGIFARVNGTTIGPISTGTVVGPSSSVVDNIAVFSTTNGRGIADSGLAASDVMKVTTGVYRIPSFREADLAVIPGSVDRVYVEAYDPTPGDLSTLIGGAYYKRVDSEPLHDLKFQNNGWWAVDELAVTPFMTGAAGDGVTDDTDAIISIVAYSYATGVPIDWPDADYLTTESIPNFWDVVHTGAGRVLRGGDVWYITPTGDDQTNIIHVGAPNLTVNDGLSEAESTNIGQAIARIKSIGAKAQDGRWRILLHGSITSNGINNGGLPAFRNRLEIWGDEVAMNVEPTTVWDGTSSTNRYALRFDWSIGTANAFMHFRNIKFTNWNSTGLAGGIVVWASGDVLTENIWSDGCPIPTWYRQCYVRQHYGVISNAQTYGTQVSYGASGNIGGLNGEGVTFTNCNIGVSVGRQTTCYIQGSTFTDNTTHIEVTRNSRIRTQANVFNTWTRAVVYADNVGVWTPDNGGGYPDTFNMTPTLSSPVFICQSGSVHPLIQRLSGQGNTYNPGGSLATITNTSFNLVSDPAATGCTAGDFVPARVPCWWAYSPTASLTVRIYVTLAANAGGTLYLHGNGAAASSRLGEITIPTNASARAGWIEITFFTRFGASTGRYSSYFRHATLPVAADGNSANLSTTTIRSATDDVLNYRLYWQSATNDQVVLGYMTSTITA